MTSIKEAIEYLTIGEKAELYIDVACFNYPSLIFSFNINSKADIPLEISEISAQVFMTSAYMGKIHWTQLDNIYEESHKIEKIPPKGETWINLRFTPPKDFLKSKYPRNWTLKGVILFEPKVGYGATKKFNIDFKITETLYDQAFETYFNQ